MGSKVIFRYNSIPKNDCQIAYPIATEEDTNNPVRTFRSTSESRTVQNIIIIMNTAHSLSATARRLCSGLGEESEQTIFQVTYNMRGRKRGLHRICQFLLIIPSRNHPKKENAMANCAGTCEIAIVEEKRINPNSVSFKGNCFVVMRTIKQPPLFVPPS